MYKYIKGVLNLKMNNTDKLQKIVDEMIEKDEAFQKEFGISYDKALLWMVTDWMAHNEHVIPK